MFEFIRTHQRLMQFVLLLFIFPSFAFLGIESYLRGRAGDDAVAKVAGRAITQQEFDFAQREQTDRYRQMLGAQFDPKMLNTPEARQALLENLIGKRAMAHEIAANHMQVSDASLQKSILEIPGLIKQDGSFDAERYKNVLASQGMTPAMYEEKLRDELVVRQLMVAVQGTTMLPKTVAAQLSALNEQEREVQALTFKAGDYAAQVKLTDEMLKASYEKNAAQFQIPETVKAEYVVLSLDDLAAQTNVSDAEVAAFYEQNKKQYTVDEQRRASHILIATKKDASEADKAAAKAKAENLLAQLRKNPENFAKLAKENSQDPGSAERGGDLDFFGKGMMVKAFEDTAFQLKQGEISNVVQSEFGFHIIQLTAIKPATLKSLDEVKSAILTEIKKQKASKAYAEAAETFTNTLEDQYDSLKPAADKLKLKIEQASGLGREANPAVPQTVATNNPKFLKALFADGTLKSKRNTEAVEVAPHTLIAGRVLEYKPASRRPFDEVKAIVQAQLLQTEAVQLAQKDGETKLAALKAADNAAGFGAAITVTRLKNADLPPAAVQEIMKTDTQKLPAFVGVAQSGYGYTIYRVNKVVAGTPDPARRLTEQHDFEQKLSQQEMLSYLELLKKKAKVEIIKPQSAEISVKQ